MAIDADSLPATTAEVSAVTHRPKIHVPLSLVQRQAVVVALDLLTLNVALILLYGLLDPSIRFGSVADFWGQHAWTLVLANIVWWLAAFAGDLYEPASVADLRPNVVGVAKVLLGLIFASLLAGLAAPGLAPASKAWALPAVASIVYLLIVMMRQVCFIVLAKPAFRTRALIVDAGSAGVAVGREIVRQLGHSHTVVGYVDDDVDKVGQVVVPIQVENPRFNSSRGLAVLGTGDDLSELIAHNGVNALVVSPPHPDDSELMQVTLECLAHGVEIIPMPVLYERLTGRVPIAHVGNNWWVAMPLRARSASMLRRFVKRTFDLVSASLGVLLLAPFFPLVAAAIYLESPGPVIYKQERVGRLGKRFFVYKLRSMVPDAEPNGPVWAEKDDPRVTRVGRILRKTHLDEFPQLINIIRGEMSAVGPRPERPSFVSELAHEIPFYHVRHAVKPGMAGWGLVRQGYGSSTEDALLKLQYDLYYIKHESLWLDLGIILRTVLDAISLRGR